MCFQGWPSVLDNQLVHFSLENTIFPLSALVEDHCSSAWRAQQLRKKTQGDKHWLGTARKVTEQDTPISHLGWLTFACNSSPEVHSTFFWPQGTPALRVCIHTCNFFLIFLKNNNKQGKMTFFFRIKEKNRKLKMLDVNLKIHLDYNCGISVICFSQTQNKTSNTKPWTSTLKPESYEKPSSSFRIHSEAELAQLMWGPGFYPN